jgi:hypothetical protein
LQYLALGGLAVLQKAQRISSGSAVEQWLQNRAVSRFFNWHFGQIFKKTSGFSTVETSPWLNEIAHPGTILQCHYNQKDLNEKE